MTRAKTFLSTLAIALSSLVVSTAVAAPRQAVCESIDQIFADEVTTVGMPLFNEQSGGTDPIGIMVVGHRVRTGLPFGTTCVESRWTHGRIIVSCNFTEIKTEPETATWKDKLKAFSMTIRQCYTNEPSSAFQSTTSGAFWDFNVTMTKHPGQSLSLYVAETAWGTFVAGAEFIVAPTYDDLLRWRSY